MVVRNNHRLTKDQAKSLIASGLQRASVEHGIDRLALEAGCSRRCIEKALAHDTLPEAHTLLNALTLDPSVLHEALFKLGLQVVPLDWEQSEDMALIHEISGLLTEWLDAMKDGRRDHQELAKLGNRLRGLLPKLTSVLGEADKLKVVA